MEDKYNNLIRKMADLGHDPELLKKLSAIGYFDDKVALNEKIKEFLENNPNLRSPNEPPPRSQQTTFPPYTENQVIIYKLLQKQMGFGKQFSNHLAFKGFVEDMDAIYRGDYRFGKKEGIGEAVAACHVRC